MILRKLNLGPHCNFVETTYGEGNFKDFDLEYVEHSQDYWNSDVETCVPITKEKAEEIVKFLRESFGI